MRRALICQEALLHGRQVDLLGAPTVASFRVFRLVRRTPYSVVDARDANVAEDLLCHVAPTEILVHHLPAGTKEVLRGVLTYSKSLQRLLYYKAPSRVRIDELPEGLNNYAGN